MDGRWPEERRRTLVAASIVFVVALVARLTFLRIAGYYFNSDSEQYYQIARNILDHFAYSLSPVAPFFPTIRRPPLYPFFLALTGAPSMGAIAVVHAVLASFGAVLLFLLCTLALPRKWSLGAAIAYALHPGAIWMSSCILGETLYTVLLLAAVLLMAMALKADRLAWTSLAGAALGLAALNRPIALLLPCAMLAALAVLPQVRRRLAHSVVMTAVAIAVVAPWTVRCTLVSGEFVLVQGCLPVNVYMAARTDWDPADEDHIWYSLKKETACGKHLDKALGADLTPQEQLAADKICSRDARSLIENHFGAWLVSRLRRHPHLYLNSYDNFTRLKGKSYGAALASRDYATLLIKIAMLLAFSVAPLALSIVGLADIRRDPALALCAAAWVYTLLIHFPTWVEIRFWMPVVPFQLASATAGSLWLWRRRPVARDAFSAAAPAPITANTNTNG